MVNDEQKFVLPIMRQWLGEPTTVYDEEDAWQKTPAESIAPLMAQFRTLRNEQLALLPLFKEST